MIKALALLVGLALSGLAVATESLLAGRIVGPNPLADPFTAHATVELPPVPSFPPAALQLPAPPLFSNNQPLPQGLRAMLIRDKGYGVLGSGEVGALSIPVAHGKPVRIAGQQYYAEVTRTEIKLFSSLKGKLVWEGGLTGVAPPSVPVDASQVAFVPPLSAGVSPGLKSVASAGGVAAQPIVSVLGSQ